MHENFQKKFIYGTYQKRPKSTTLPSSFKKRLNQMFASYGHILPEEENVNIPLDSSLDSIERIHEVGE